MGFNLTISEITKKNVPDLYTTSLEQRVQNCSINFASGRGLEQAMSAVASLEQVTGGSPGQERKGNTRERG